MSTMLALQWDGHSLQLNQVEIPAYQTDEALIKVESAGICNTDLEIIRGYYPFQGTLGHEFVGTIQDADDLTLIGKRVVSDINFACHHCSMCLAGNPHHCLNRKTLGINSKDGAFAEYLTAPISNLVFIPDSLSNDKAVFAEPLAAALEILEQIDFSAISEVAVLGDGKLGLLITMCLCSQGLKTTLIGHHQERYALVSDPKLEFLSSAPEKKYPVVIEATGSSNGFQTALNLTQAKGTLVLKSTYADGFEFNPAALVVNEITLLGSRCGPMEKAIDLMANSHIAPERLIENTFNLEEGREAVAKAQQKGVLKVTIKP
jgi:threonine dehydrogenase-like Zn-dependent dehydrogenase